MEYERNIRKDEVLRILGFKKSKLYVLIKAGVVPQPIKPSTKTSLWKLSDIITIQQKFANGEIKF